MTGFVTAPMLRIGYSRRFQQFAELFDILFRFDRGAVIMTEQESMRVRYFSGIHQVCFECLRQCGNDWHFPSTLRFRRGETPAALQLDHVEAVWNTPPPLRTCGTTLVSARVHAFTVWFAATVLLLQLLQFPVDGVFAVGDAVCRGGQFEVLE